MNKATLTRAELYTLVWSEPLSALAGRFKLTEYKLRKLCIGLSIPLPRTGHWKRVQAGDSVQVPPLPKVTGKRESVTLSFQATEIEQNPEERKHAISRRALDPLLVAVKQTMTRKEDFHLRNGLRHSDGHQLEIRVASKNVIRALQFMNQFLYALRARGHSIGEESQAVVNGQIMGIRCREKTTRVTLTKPYAHSELRPTGILAFQLVDKWSWQICELKDGREALEEKIPAILIKMESESVRMAQERQDLEKRWAEQEEIARIKKEQEQKRQSELIGFQGLLVTAARWRQATDLRDYLAALERYASATRALTGDLHTWLAWARDKADWYDPLLESPNELLADVDRNTLKKKSTQGSF